MYSARPRKNCLLKIKIIVIVFLLSRVSLLFVSDENIFIHAIFIVESYGEIPDHVPNVSTAQYAK